MQKSVQFTENTTTIGSRKLAPPRARHSARRANVITHTALTSTTKPALSFHDHRCCCGMLFWVHSVGSPPNCLDKGLPARTWRLRGLCAKIRDPNQGKSDRVEGCAIAAARSGQPPLARSSDSNGASQARSNAATGTPPWRYSSANAHTHEHTRTHPRTTKTHLQLGGDMRISRRF